jgi:phosphoribosylanthranilate isomerase
MSQQPTSDNRQPKLKVCGLTKLTQIEELISLNTDFLGFIFYEKSPRFVLNSLTLKEIKSINHQGKVGVFVNESLETIIEIAEKADLNYIQLHGDENNEFISELKNTLNDSVGIIKVIRIGIQDSIELQTAINDQRSTINYLLFDTDSKAFGGTGKTFDWQLLNKLDITKPYFLSGGISANNFENVNLLNQQPFALDINSKFEIDPVNKNLEKIKEFRKALNLEFEI